MFLHDRRMQYSAKPDHPDPLFARRMQEVLGGQFGEITVMLQYLFQGFNCRGPAKYRDMLLDIGTEEIGHVEMLATMIARLLEKSPVEDRDAAAGIPIVGAIMGGLTGMDAILAGMDPQHLIVTGQGASPKDSNGVPWSAGYVAASGNLLADFRSNLHAESQGRLQVCRLYEMTDDAGVRDMLSFLIARDTMHQNQWIAAIAELEADGIDGTPVPLAFPVERQNNAVAYQFWNNSQGAESSTGRWASGPSPDGKGEFTYVGAVAPLSNDMGLLNASDPRLYGMNPVKAKEAEAEAKAAMAQAEFSDSQPAHYNPLLDAETTDEADLLATQPTMMNQIQ